MAKTRLGVLFGSRSVEHEVSIITAAQLMKSADPEKYDVVPVYIGKDGVWYSNPALKELSFFKPLNTAQEKLQQLSNDAKDPSELLQKLDAAIICCHGTFGEDGSLQGMLELHGVPYQGPGVLGSALCMDKIACKQVLQAENIPIVLYQWFSAQEWRIHKDQVMQKIAKLKFPIFLKPANMGSSIGIAKLSSPSDLEDAVTTALAFDDRILVEQSVEDCIEVNVSVLGFETFQVSATEQPLKTGELLSYADKYTRSGGKKSGMASLNRRIPAPISAALSKKIQDTAVSAARALDCSGVVRMDFFADPSSDSCWLNEVNTIPGSMSFYLWEASGIPFRKLVDELVAVALKRKNAAQQKIRSIDTSILG